MISFIWWNLILPLVLTVVIEGVLAWVVLRFKHDVMTVVLVQCITNPILNFCLVLNEYYWHLDYAWLVVFLEVVVVVVEAMIYAKCFELGNRKKVWGFSIGANVVAVGLGLLLSV